MKNTIVKIYASAIAALILTVLATAIADASTVAYYRFEQGSGTDMYDSVTSSNQGTQNAGFSEDVPISPVPQTGQSNTYSMYFDGSATATVSTGQTFILNSAYGDATLECWLNIPVQSHHSIFWSRGDSIDDNRFNIYFNSGGYIGVDYLSPTGASHNLLPGTFAVPLNTWTHFAITRIVNSPTQNTYYFYKDGVQVGDPVVDNNPDLPTGASWKISGRNSYYYQGYIDELRFSDTALSPSQFLNAEAVPEPSVVALLCAGLPVFAAGRRLRRRVTRKSGL